MSELLGIGLKDAAETLLPTALKDGGGSVKLDDEYYFQGSQIWKLAINGWL